LIDRSIDNRKRAFGVAMYDYLSPLSSSVNFYAASDKLTELVRPNLINAQKEILALAAKRVKQKEALAMAETSRAAAFPTKAETYGQKLMNFGKAGYLHGGETKIKTELSVTDRLIKGHKEDFGVNLYNAFANAEDNEGFLPTDRQIRNVYDTCRQDITSFEQQKKAKEDEIVELGGKRVSSETPVVEETNTNTTTMANTTTTYNNNNNSNSNSISSSSSSSYGNPSYGATTTAPQSASFPTTAQQPPDAGSFYAPPTASTGVAVAGTGMFSHPVANSSAGNGGFSDNPSSGAAPVDPFSNNNNNNQGYNSNNPSMSMSMPMSMNSGAAPVVDPFSTFSDNNNNAAAPPSSSQQKRSSDLLLDF